MVVGEDKEDVRAFADRFRFAGCQHWGGCRQEAGTNDEVVQCFHGMSFVFFPAKVTKFIGYGYRPF